MSSREEKNYSNRILRNYSFQGQDLTGVSFDGSDIRGCNFEDAILVNSSFRNVRTGTTCWQAFELLVIALPITVLLFFIYSNHGTSEEANKDKYFAIGSINLASTLLVVFSFLLIKNAVLEINQNHSLSLFLSILCFFACIFLLIYFSNKMIRIIQSVAGTSFAQADLTSAKFSGAYIESTDFSNAVIADVDWVEAVFGENNKGVS